MGPNLTPEQYRLVFTAVRRYQVDMITSGEEYKNCNKILDKLYPYAYTQRQEQPT